MTVKLYIEQMNRIRGIVSQDISMFDYTPIGNIFKMRKEAAIQLENAKFDERDQLVQIIENCEITIKNFLLL